METLVKRRSILRKEFDELYVNIEQSLAKDKFDSEEVEVKFRVFTETCDQIRSLDEKIKLRMIKKKVKPTEDEEKAEYETVLQYKTKAETLRVRKEKRVPMRQSSGIRSSSTINDLRLLPPNLPQFSGELKDWLSWYAQFRKIDEDPELSGSDKFWHLMQALKPGTDPYTLVSGYPHTNENYEEAITQLKKQFGNRDHLVQTYIRELLELVTSNVKEKVSTKTLYLKLDSHLRALKSLELSQADPGTWLLPLVEASLPERVQARWLNSPLSKCDPTKEDPPRNKLDVFMSYLQHEVDTKTRLDINRSFSQRHGKDKGSRHFSENKPQSSRGEKRSAQALSSFHTGNSQTCAFCDFKKNHSTKDCWRAKKLSYDEKVRILRDKNLCFRCGGSHRAKDDFHRKLKCSICGRGHLEILCRDYSSTEEESKPEKRPRSESTAINLASSSNLECSGSVILQTLFVKVKGEGKEILVRAFIDNGSQRSYITKWLVRELQMKPFDDEEIEHLLFGGRKTEVIIHDMYRVTAKSADGDREVQLVLRDSEEICGLIPPLHSHGNALYQELCKTGIHIPEYYNNKRRIDILIGSDMYGKIVNEQIKKLKCGAVATSTQLGWTVSGELETSVTTRAVGMINMTLGIADVSVPKLWELEALGIRDPIEIQNSKDLARATLAKFIKNITRLVDGRYSVKLPWRGDCSQLGTNKSSALARLKSASRKLIELNVFEQYDSIFSEWLTRGFIEEAKDSKDRGVHYLPHRCVVKESVTTPVRPVFDASSQTHGGSLNDFLHKGENLMNLIPEILLQFRKKRVGFTADIYKAFQMISVDPMDRDKLRFLWWENKEMRRVVEYRHARVPFGATCSPFILGAVLHYHLTNLSDEEKEIGLRILKTMYVDNCVSSENTFEEYQTFRSRSTEILDRAKMDLRLWLSNLDEFEDETTHTVSVLGLFWDRKRDELFVKPILKSIPVRITKRVALSVGQTLFDPIGHTCPAKVPILELLQKAWIQKLDWDENLPEEEAEVFRKWASESDALEKMRVPRNVTMGDSNPENWSLHVFADASKKAYAAAVFLRIKHSTEVTVQLVGARSRIAPKHPEDQPTPMPRLELLACFIAARLLSVIVEAFELQSVPVYLWSDSTIAIEWIHRGDNWRQFVANRVKEIVRITGGQRWRHIPGMYNPADLPSRGAFPNRLLRSRWWEGPQWLYLESDSWPTSSDVADEEKVLAERKKEKVVSATMVCLQDVSTGHSYRSTVRIVGWVRRFLHNYLIRDITKRKMQQHLSLQEKISAEMVIIKQIQREEFDENSVKELSNLEIVEDETWKILCVKTRIIYGNQPASFKYPILLPNKRPEVRKMIDEMHRDYCHAGVGFLCMKLREKYWILKARQTVRSIIFKCDRCRRHAARPIVPPPAPLPLDRMESWEVFDVVGVDLAGPLTLKNGKAVWFVIFTCAKYRAVHFEIVTALTVHAFLETLGNFVKKFHRPRIIYSDNGTNFRGTNNWMSKLNWEEISREVEGIMRIIWKFSPALASWFGAMWERLIRDAKAMIKRTVGKGSLTHKELESILMTIADVMNSKPLTYLSENPEDLEPLTPNHFLRPFGITAFPELELSADEKLRFRYNHVKTLQRDLKRRFEKEYLSLLVNRKKQGPTVELKVGDLVFVGDNTKKRVNWPRGRILEFLPGPDGVNRVAKVKVETGVLIRAVQHLYPLELQVRERYPRVGKRKAVSRYGRPYKLPKRN